MPSRPGQDAARACSESLDVELAVGRVRERAVGRAAVADAAGEPPRVDAGDADQIVRFEPGVERLRSRANWTAR